MAPLRWVVSTFTATLLCLEKRSLAVELGLSNSAGSGLGSEDHPSLEVELRAKDVNRCSNFDLSRFGRGRSCGTPMAAPCFDRSRCQDGLTIYIHDHEVIIRVPIYMEQYTTTLLYSYIRHEELSPCLTIVCGHHYPFCAAFRTCCIPGLRLFSLLLVFL